MRIEYTLPSLIPLPTPATTAPAEEFPGAFTNTMRRVKTPPCSNWRQLLRLDRPECGAMAFGPPTKPPGLDMRDAASERARWRNLLDKSSDSLLSGAGSGNADPQALESIGRMVQLLMVFQRQESGISARSLNETRG